MRLLRCPIWTTVVRARTVPDGEDSPVVTLPKERATGTVSTLSALQTRDVHDHPIVVTELRPGLGRIDEIDDRADPLLLDAERGDLEEAGRIDARHASPGSAGRPSRRSARAHRA